METLKLFLLLFISFSVAHGLANVSLNTTLIEGASSPLTGPLIICLSEDGETCKQGYKTWMITKDQMEEEGVAGIRRVQRIDKPWSNKMYLIFRSGSIETVDISHLTVKNGTLSDVTIFNSLRISFTLACVPHFFGDLCLSHCEEKPDLFACDSNGNPHCVGNRFGFHCREKLCLNDAIYINGTCECTSGWTGKRCNEVLAESLVYDESITHVRVPSETFDESRPQLPVILLSLTFLLLALVILARCICKTMKPIKRFDEMHTTTPTVDCLLEDAIITVEATHAQRN